MLPTLTPLTLNARNIIARMPASTKAPTLISIVRIRITLLNSPYITSVRMKSNASTTTDEYTTVLVVAALMPSAVGTESYP